MATTTKETVTAAIKPASTNGKSVVEHHPTTAADLEREYAFPIVPPSLEPIPNGATLNGPRADNSLTFKGTFKQSGLSKETLTEWYRLMDLGRILDNAAANYLKKAMGWSYHAPCAGHEGIQLALGVSFRQKQDYLFPYYRDLMTCLAGGLTVEEIILNGLSKETDIAGGGRHMSNHFAKMSIEIGRAHV